MEATREKLVSDLKVLIDDAEELLKAPFAATFAELAKDRERQVDRAGAPTRKA